MAVYKESKTFNVDDFRGDINRTLAESTCNSDIRQGLINALEHVLRMSGNYKGFQHLRQDEVPEGHLPGVRPDEKDLSKRFDNTDRTRVWYS